MKNNLWLTKFALILVYIFIALFIIGIFALPAAVTWYVEVRGREPSLPTTIMLTCYPCAPFAAIALLSVKNVLKAILKNEAFTDKVIKNLKTICICAFSIAVITLIATIFYMPFFVCFVCFAFMGLITLMISGLFKEKNKDE